MSYPKHPVAASTTQPTKTQCEIKTIITTACNIDSQAFVEVFEQSANMTDSEILRCFFSWSLQRDDKKEWTANEIENVLIHGTAANVTYGEIARFVRIFQPAIGLDRTDIIDSFLDWLA